MIDKKTSKFAAHYYPFLDGKILTEGNLIEISTSNKRSSIKMIRENLTTNKKHPYLEDFINEKLDVAIVIYLQKNNYKIQDVDNIAKVILDALKKPKIDDGHAYFFEDDKQIIRLLVYKKEREDHLDFNTCQVSISVRIHDSTKEMGLFVDVFDENSLSKRKKFSET